MGRSGTPALAPRYRRGTVCGFVFIAALSESNRPCGMTGATHRPIAAPLLGWLVGLTGARSSVYLL